MTWYQHLIGFAVTALSLAIVLLILVCGLWLQGWLAGRKYYNRARPDPWGTSHGYIDVRLLRAGHGEDRLVEILPSTSFVFERQTGEMIDLTVGRISDGESAPTFTWPLTGAPFNGRARDAALGPHDEECERKRRPDTEAHGICYEVMRSRGLWWRGPIKHAVLLNWGSRW